MTKQLLFLSVFSIAVAAAQTTAFDNGSLVVAGAINYCTESGSANTYACTEATGKLSGYTAGMEFSFRATHSNTGTATLNINSIGAVTIFKITPSGLAALAAGDIQSGTDAIVEYDGSNFEILNPANSASSSATGGFGTSISSSAPMYLFAHFRDDDQSLYLDYSYDGAHFKTVSPFGVAGSGTIRDPSMTYINGTYYFVATGGGSNTGFWYSTSTDLRTFTTPQTVALSGLPAGTTGTWAPEFFQDTNGSWYVVFTNAVSNTLHFYAVPWTVASGAAGFGAPQSIALLGALSTHIFDPQISVSGGTYRLIFADADSSWPGTGHSQYISVATATSLLGPYTVLSSIQSNRNLLGFGTAAEGPTAFTLSNGCTRIIADTFVETTTLAYNSDSAHYTQKYTDTCDSFSSFSGLQTLPIAKSEQGTVIALTQPAQATTVLSAALANGVNVVPSHFGVNVLNPAYTLEIGSTAATSSLQYDEPASFAANPGDGNDAIWSACGLSAAQYCPNPPASNGMWLMNGAGDWGQIQINNPTNGEAGLTFTDQATGWGAGKAAPFFWHMGENFPIVFTDTAGPIVGNHHFYLAMETTNANTRKSPLWVFSDTGQVHATYGLSLGEGAAGTQAWLNITKYASLDAPSANVVNIGNGAVGDHSATVKVGVIQVGSATWSTGSTAPSGSCTNGSLYTNTSAGGLYVCQSAAWVAK